MREHSAWRCLLVAWYDFNVKHARLDAYDSRTLTERAVLDRASALQWSGNHALGDGRLRIARDGSLLFLGRPEGVAIYRTPL